VLGALIPFIFYVRAFFSSFDIIWVVLKYKNKR